MKEYIMGLNINDIAEVLEEIEVEDQTVSNGNGFEYPRIPVGKHPVRLVSYIELGSHAQKPYQGVDRKPADMVALTFEFLGKNTTEITDGKVTSAMRKTVVIKKSFHEKAAYRKLFEKMREGDSTIKNMSQMVGTKAWMMGVEWSQGGRGIPTPKLIAEAEAKAAKEPQNKELIIWDNIRNDEGYMLTPAVRPIVDEDTGEQTGTKSVKVRPVFGELALFLWNQPAPKFWDSIFVEGSYEKGEGDNVEVISKNRWQIMCKEALNFEGSPLNDMLDVFDVQVAEEVPAASDEAPVDVEDDRENGASDVDELFA